MNTIFSIRKTILGIWQGHLGWALLLASLLSVTAAAQSLGTPTTGMTPSGLSPGNSAGSFPLSGFDTVNLYNGNLNFSLPLLQIGGRGSNRTAVTLTIDSPKWQVGTYSIAGEICLKSTCARENYLHFPGPNWWLGLRPGYGPGVLHGRRMGETEFCSVPAGQIYSPTLVVKKMLQRLTFTNSDGTEVDLRDSQTGGQPLALADVNGNGQSRGNVFISADGTAMTFVSDATIYDYRAIPEFCNGVIGIDPLFFPSGFLHFADGTVYRIDNGLVSWSRDRNGNKVSYSYDSFHRVVRIIDQLNHEAIITYGDPYNQYSTVPYDEILYKSFGGAQRGIRVWKALLSQTLRGDLSRVTYQELFPTLNAPSGYYDNEVVSAVELPDGRRYQLYYNNYGELARVELPTGGAFEYDYTPGSGVIDNGGIERAIYRRVVERRVYRDNVTLEGKMLFNATYDPTVSTEVVVDHQDPNGALLAREKHYFFGDPVSSILPVSGAAPRYYSNWKESREYQTDELDVAGNALRRAVNTWEQRAPVSWWTGSADSAPPNDPRLVETMSTLLDTNQVAKTQFAYDKYNNRTDVYEHDFGAGAPGPLIRRTYTSYLTTNGNQGNVNYATDNNIHIRNLPVQTIVYDASGSVRSQTDFVYDDYGAFPLVDCPGIVQHDGGFHTGYGTRGNLTGVITRNPGGSPSEIHLNNQYDIAGNLVKAVDGRGIPTDFDFSDRFGSPGDDARLNAGAPELAGGFSYAFPTKVTNALGHTTYTQYDYYLGKDVNTEDDNGMISSIAYNDPLDRPTQGIQARYKVGSGVPAERRQTTITYDDTNRVITTSSDLTTTTFNDNILTSKSYYDGLGRARRSAAREGATWAITDTRFDALGRVSQVSNPYRAADPGSASPPSGLWTTTDYDALSRVVRGTAPDGAHVDTAYNGNQVTVTDQAGKRRRSETDALRRLIRVTEDPGNMNYDTYYSYDALGNLRLVTQGTQTRTFIYDSFSRLMSATNPESGTITYAYDSNGNLIKKEDARGVRMTMTYDALNRVKSKVYAGTTPEGTAAANATPRVDYFYDDCSGLPSGAPCWPGTPSKGRLIGVTYGGGSEGTYYKYDGIGRIVTNHQRQGTANYVTAYKYNRAGSVTQEDRGGSSTRRRNVMDYDEADRLSRMRTGYYSGVSGISLSDLVSNISYTPFGALQSETYGNGLIHSMGYNERLQPTEITLGRLDNLESVFRINYIFGTADNVNSQDYGIAPDRNNGNMARIKYFISGALQYTQTFQFDMMNRLSYAVEHNNGVYNDDARAWYQTFTYDRWGNRGINVANTSDNADAANSALQLADFSEANNRITRAGFAYDAAGNLTDEPGKRYIYDAEGRIITATVVGGGTIRYVYDGNGRRVKKIVGGVATRCEYGAGGELIAEWNDADTNRVVLKDYFYKGGELIATTKTGTSDKYEYATADHLGTPRAWTDKDGNLVAGGRHDYLPFGEELFAGYGARATDQGYAASSQQDGQRKQFDAYERDPETGLDFAQARYCSSVQGRFTSPDPTLLSVNGFNPQTWNRYTFVINNPLAYVDPLGLWAIRIDIFYKKNKDGSDRLDGDGNRIIDRVAVSAVKTRDDDNGASLASQLGLTGKDAAKLAERVGSGDNVRLSELGGIVGGVYGEVESGLTAQAKWEAKNRGNLAALAAQGKYGPENNDCSGTSCRIGLGDNIPLIGTNVLDPRLDTEARSIAERDARVGDIIRYAKSDNVATHFANFIFRDDNGTPVAFSKSGTTGPYVISNVAALQTALYGTVRGRNSSDSGYYRRR